MAYRMSTPSKTVSAGVTTTPPPNPVRAPRKPAIAEMKKTSGVNSAIVIYHEHRAVSNSANSWTDHAKLVPGTYNVTLGVIT